MQDDQNIGVEDSKVQNSIAEVLEDTMNQDRGEHLGAGSRDREFVG